MEVLKFSEMRLKKDKTVYQVQRNEKSDHR